VQQVQYNLEKNEVFIMIDTKTHYDSVTRAWNLIMGNNLHYGYFESPDNTLEQATHNLIDKLASYGRLSDASKILDVGCGIGNPAFHLYEKYKSRLLGISISPIGIEMAQEKAKKLNIESAVQFLTADALDNKLPDTTFDIAWVMESSHLMPDKAKLCTENYRVLKPDGQLLLCDLILIEPFNVQQIYTYRRELATLDKAFGKAKMETLETYTQYLGNAGFRSIQTYDISKNTIATLHHWKNNSLNNTDELSRLFPEGMLQTFLESCDILIKFFTNKILGYGIVTALK